MATPDGRISSRFLPYLLLAFFVALLATMPAVYVLPPDGRMAFTIVEWLEMLAGTVSAIIAFVAVFLRTPRVASPVTRGWSRHKRIAICGLSVWCIFWLIALLVRPWSD